MDDFASGPGLLARAENLVHVMRLGCWFTGIDLSADFARLAAGRLAQAVADRTEGSR